MTTLARRVASGLLTVTTTVAIGVGAVPPTAAHADGAFFGPARTARLLSSKVVYVEEHVGARYDSALRSALPFVDRYTGSAMRFGKCRSGYRCIRVIQSNATHGHGAWTTSTNSRRTSTIRLSSALGRRNWSTRRSIIAHELGHANGITGHNARCTSLMWSDYTCRGRRLPPRTFTPAERAKLARW
jgi:hypothetical protein